MQEGDTTSSTGENVLHRGPFVLDHARHGGRQARLHGDLRLASFSTIALALPRRVAGAGQGIELSAGASVASSIDQHHATRDLARMQAVIEAAVRQELGHETDGWHLDAVAEQQHDVRMSQCRQQRRLLEHAFERLNDQLIGLARELEALDSDRCSTPCSTIHFAMLALRIHTHTFPFQSINTIE